MSILNFLKRLVDDELAKEGITPELLEMVDLSIAYSPVIPLAGGGIDEAVVVRPWGFVRDNELPEKFEVPHPQVQNPVSRDALKVMRARYLLARDAYYGPRLHHFFHGSIDEEADVQSVGFVEDRAGTRWGVIQPGESRPIDRGN